MPEIGDTVLVEGVVVYADRAMTHLRLETGETVVIPTPPDRPAGPRPAAASPSKRQALESILRLANEALASGDPVSQARAIRDAAAAALQSHSSSNAEEIVR
jgi:hypothetical protein